jgi:hypothetical protein
LILLDKIMKTRTLFSVVLLLTTAFTTSAQGFNGKESKDLMRSPMGADGNLPPSPYAQKPLPEIKGVLSWKSLADVKTVKRKNGFAPEFSKGVASLNKTEVRLQGFMMPLEMGDKQKRFLLVALPPTCSYCLPGGPEQMVEVQAKTPVKYGFEPIVVAGKFAVLQDDPMGLFYRLTDAVPVAR